ncbi:MAG: two-component system, NtrC family, response regulator HydG [Pseudomonadota bacterium]|nr:two-component system, NtrC family, response regulator HydG [Pseudomonadota bacterium]
MKKTRRVHFIDDDATAGDLFRRFSREKDYAPVIFRDPVRALEDIRLHGSDLVITDLSMPGLSGLDLLQAIRQTNIELPVIMITGFSTEDNAIRALRLGAADFLKKPFDMDALLALIDKKLNTAQQRKEEIASRPRMENRRNQHGMIGNAASIRKIFDIIDRIADIRCNVIIEGESGTGKELVAHAIHHHSLFADKPFIVIDCGSLTDTLLESELFGHEKGAFTGASQSKSGLLEVASGGSVFLDEICNISDAMQMKLMRAVQSQQITRVGGVQPINIDVRFIAATNRNIEEMIAARQFRHDLYHRLNVVSIRMPPLRERREDIEPLLKHFVDEFSRRYNRKAIGFDDSSMHWLKNYSWPGNIRELRNLVERSIALADNAVLHVEQGLIQTDTHGGLDADNPTLEQLEKRYILKILEQCHGNREQTASILGINKSTLWRKMQGWQ